MEERQQVIDWLIAEVGWTLHKVDAKPAGKTVYIFWEAESGGWNNVHKFRADQLRWKYMRDLALEHLPELRAKSDAIWAEYIAARIPNKGHNQ